MLLLCLLLSGDPVLRVEGPPFLPFGAVAEYRVVTDLEGVVPVWRIADAPSGAFGTVETEPRYDPDTRRVEGARRLTLRSRGGPEGDVRLSVELRRGGRRIAARDVRIRVGELLRMRAVCRAVTNGRGGTRRAEEFREEGRRERLEEEVNRLLQAAGVRVALEAGEAVQAPDAWFGKGGRFSPVVLEGGRRARSETLKKLLAANRPGVINIYRVRDCHGRREEGGFRRRVTEHPLAGVGFRDGSVVIDDSADAETLAHEIGHALGLADLEEEGERGRMMYSIRSKRTGTAFTREEMRNARSGAARYR